MNRIKYILDMSNIKAPDDTASGLYSAVAADVRERPEKRGGAKRLFIALAVFAVISAVALSVFFISKRRERPHGGEAPSDPSSESVFTPRIPEDTNVAATFFVMYEDDLPGYDVFRLAAAYTAVTDSREIVIKDCAAEQMTELFGELDEGAALSTYAGALSFVTSSAGLLYGRADMAGAAVRIASLPEDLRTFIIGVSDRGTFRYLMTVTLMVKMPEKNDKREFPEQLAGLLYTPDGEEIGMYYYIGYDISIPCISFYEGSGYSRFIKIYKTRVEFGNPVIYREYEAGADTFIPFTGFDSSFDPSDDDVSSRVFVGGEFRITSPAGIPDVYRNIWTSAPRSSADKGYPYVGKGLLQDHMLTYDRSACIFSGALALLTGADESVGVIDQFIQMYALKRADGMTYIGLCVFSDENGFYVMNSEDGAIDVNVYYDPVTTDTPFFSSSLLVADEFTVVDLDPEGMIKEIYAVDVTGLCDILRENGRIGMEPSHEIYTYPVILGDGCGLPIPDLYSSQAPEYRSPLGRFADYPFTPYSAGLLALCEKNSPYENGTLLPALGLRLPERKKIGVCLNEAPVDFGLSVSFKQINVTGITEDGLKIGQNEYGVIHVTGYSEAGLFTTDLTGSFTGVITPAGIFPFDSVHDRNKLTVVSDGGVAVYCSFAEPEYSGFDGLYPFEKSDGLYYDTVRYVCSRVMSGRGLFTFRYLWKDNGKICGRCVPWISPFSSSTCIRKSDGEGGYILTLNGMTSIFRISKGIINPTLDTDDMSAETLFRFDGDTIVFEDDGTG